MMVVDRKGQSIDVESLLREGDVVYYDGSLMHGVNPIVGFEGSNIGRIQIFPIPAVFNNLEGDILSISRISFPKFVKGKMLWAKNRVRILLGLNPAMR
jgi:hypothetical protein